MPTYQRSRVHSTNDVIAIADHAGSHFFDAATMRFFNSRVLSDTVALDGTQAVEGARFLFLTSERYDSNTPRFYQIRIMTLGSVRDDRPAVDISTADDTHYSTPAAARRAMAALGAELASA